MTKTYNFYLVCGLFPARFLVAEGDGEGENTRRRPEEGVAMCRVAQISNPYRVTVDGDLTLGQMIKRARLDAVAEGVSPEHFPVTESGVTTPTILLFAARTRLSSGVAICELAELGFRPATLPELLALAGEYPKLGLRFPIAALGSSNRDAQGERWVPCLLSWRYRDRELCLELWNHAWRTADRFAAVPSGAPQACHLGGEPAFSARFLAWSVAALTRPGGV